MNPMRSLRELKRQQLVRRGDAPRTPSIARSFELAVDEFLGPIDQREIWKGSFAFPSTAKRMSFERQAGYRLDSLFR